MRRERKRERECGEIESVIAAEEAEKKPTGNNKKNVSAAADESHGSCARVEERVLVRLSWKSAHLLARLRQHERGRGRGKGQQVRGQTRKTNCGRTME